MPAITVEANGRQGPDAPPPLIPAERIAERVHELAAEISDAYEGAAPLVVPVLRGSFVFAADLVRALRVPHKIEFLGISSYNGTSSSGAVRVNKDIGAEIAGNDVLVVEDIVETGQTLAKTIELLKARGARSVHVVALLDKPSQRRVDIPVRWTGFEIDDVFAVGYGLDLNGRYRGLPYIAGSASGD